MQDELKLLLGKIGAFALSGAFLAALVGLVFIDVHWLHNFVHETSLTEVAQELLLLAIAGGFSPRPGDRLNAAPPGCWSAASFSAC